MTPDDAATLKALSDAVIHAGAEAERKWGVARLPLLVPLEWADKFEREAARWYDDLQRAYADGESRPLSQDRRSELLAGATRLQRAWRKLDTIATDLGAQPLSPHAWEVAGRDGQVTSIVRTTAEACALVREKRTLHVYTMDEIANIIAALPDLVSDAKTIFPGATVVQAKERGRSKVSHDDAIPF